MIVVGGPVRGGGERWRCKGERVIKAAGRVGEGCWDANRAGGWFSVANK